MKKYILSLVLTVIFSLSAASASAAGVACQPIYGGGQSCVTAANISIDKKIQNPASGQFVDNLGTNDQKFSVNQTVTFQLIVTNTGGNSIDKVIVKDVFPQFVSFVSGPGNFDANSKTLTFEVLGLGAGESRTFTVAGKVGSDSTLTGSTGITCVVNQSSAQIATTAQMSQDNSQFCIQKGIPAKTKGGLPVLPAPQMKTTPPTGPEMAVLPLLGGSGILGYFLRRRASR